MKQLVLRGAAERDAELAAGWYEGETAGLGWRFSRELDHVLARIEEAPAQFPRVAPDVRRGLLRHFPYAVYSFVEQQTVAVLAIPHLRCHPEVWKPRVGGTG